jgi:hypothetical protein
MTMPRILPLCSLLALGVLVVALPGCGYDGYDYFAEVWVSNQTDTTTMEDVDAFRMAQFGEPFTGDLLGAPLSPGDDEFLGDFESDYYDAEADLSGGGLVEWFDEPLYDGDTVYFDVF